MSASQGPQALEPRAPFIRRPVGEHLFGTTDLSVSPSATSADRAPASDDDDGFDFHLGAYARF